MKIQYDSNDNLPALSLNLFSFCVANKDCAYITVASELSFVPWQNMEATECGEMWRVEGICDPNES
jgi:hypothetical protein